MLGALVIIVISQFLTIALVVATVMPDTATIRNPSRTFSGEPGAEPEADVSKAPNGEADLGLGSGTPPLPAIQ